MFCVSSSEPDGELIVDISFKSGFEARDYTEFAKKHDLKPIEIQVNNIKFDFHSITYFYYLATKTRRNDQLNSSCKCKSCYS